MGMNWSLLKIVRDGFLINIAAWGIAAPLQTEKFYDLTGTLTFITLTVKSFLIGTTHKTTRNWINSALVLLWSGRLGSFLFSRILKDGKDRRFDKVKTKPTLFLLYWVIQAVWCILTALPVYMINTSEENNKNNQNVSVRDIVGWGLWLGGFLLQVTADQQKSAFRAIKENKEKFITTGVWAWSQHPNYFGEMCMWWGLFISSSSQMSGIQYLSIICPMFNVYLLTQVSGIPLLKKHAKKVWGNDPLYIAYTAQTNLLIPNPMQKPIHLKK